jgi:hypothetical protein
MKIMYLHIGAGKTGTSSLQSQFAINKDVLEKYNIYYPISKNDKQAKNFKITSGNAVDLAFLLREKTSDNKMIERIIKGHILMAEGKNILLSSEIIQSFDYDKILICKNIAFVLGYQIKIIYYVRAIVDNLVSSYQQTIKRHGNTKNLDIFLKSYRNKFRETIEKIDEIFGSSNIIVKNYDLVKDNIFLNFLQSILNIEDCSNFKIENKRVNRSLTKHELSFIKYLNYFFRSRVISTLVSNTLIHINPIAKYELLISKNDFEIVSNLYTQDLAVINSYLPESEKPLNLVDSIKINE